MSLNVAQQEMADAFAEIIGEINTGRSPKEIQRLVEKKVAQLTAQEPFYLMGVLDNDKMTPFEKAGAFTALRHTATGEERYPEEYHRGLKENTH